MNPQEKDFLEYLKSCKLPDLARGEMTPTDQMELRIELEQVFVIIEKQEQQREALEQKLRALLKEKKHRY